MNGAPKQPMTELPFTRVLIKVGSRQRALPASEFLELPLTERIEAILRREVEFYDGATPVSRPTALSALRLLRVK
jgi:hypothetical protein